MNYGTLGKTGLSVSKLGFGTWGIAGSSWVGAEDEESLRSLGQAIAAGVNFIDTALIYGDGHSERLVGQAVRDAPGRVYVATKVRPLEWPEDPGVPAGLPPSAMFPGEWIVECTERSLHNLGLDTIDVQQLHAWSDEWLGQGDWWQAIEQLRDEGKIRYFGVSLNDHEPGNGLALVRSGLVDTVQVIYNIFDQSPEDELLPAAQAAGVGVIARAPLDEGGLTGKLTPETVFAEEDFRSEYFGGDRKAQIVQRTQAIATDLEVATEELAEVALRFCLSHPAVSTVIAGMRSVEHVRANVKAAELGPLGDDARAALRQHRWVRNFYLEP